MTKMMSSSLRALTMIKTLVPILVLLSAPVQAGKEDYWHVMTSHVYHGKGLELRIVTHVPREVYCEVHDIDGIRLAWDFIEIRPMVTRHTLYTPYTELIFDYSCSEAKGDTAMLSPPIRAPPWG